MTIYPSINTSILTIICSFNLFIISVVAVSGGYFGFSNTNVLYTNVMCNGTEQLFSQCPKTLVTDNNGCQTSMDVGVVCFGKKREWESERAREQEREREREDKDSFLNYYHCQFYACI